MKTYFIKNRIAHFYSNCKIAVSLKGFITHYLPYSDHSLDMIKEGLVDKVIDIPFILNSEICNLELNFTNKCTTTNSSFVLNGDMAEQFNSIEY